MEVEHQRFGRSLLLGAYFHFFSASTVASTNKGCPPITLTSLTCPSGAITTTTLGEVRGATFHQFDHFVSSLYSSFGRSSQAESRLAAAE
jgi:hypothetical protein